MTTETVFWLIRHPEPEASAQGRCYGSLDVDLSVAGREQAQALAARLAAEPFAAIYTSPRRRCLQAAERIAAARDCRCETLEALRELDFGEFEGRTYEEIEARYPELYRQWMERPTEVRFPSGESFEDMRKRVLDAFAMLRRRHAEETAAVVTHGGAIRIILADALGMPPSHIFRIAQRYAAVNRLRYFGDEPVVELVNASAS